MATKAKHFIPEGNHALQTYIVVRGAAKAIDFYKQAFGATERYRLPMPDGTVGHAELQLGDCILMLADEAPAMGAVAPEAGKRPPFSLMLYVEDCDAVFKRAIAAGAKEERAVADQFYGDRSGMIADPFGHVWSIATHKEVVSPEEMNERMAKMAPPA